MAQKPKTQIKHDNLAAQISVLKHELGTVNQELTIKIKERDSSNNELLSSRKELDNIKEKWSDIQVKSNTKLEELKNKEQELVTKSAALKEEELAFIEKMKVDKKSFEDKVKLYENTILDLQGKIQLRKQDVRNEQETVKHFQDLSKELNKDIKVLSLQRQGLSKDVEELNRRIVDDLGELDKQLERREKRLKEIERKILEGQDKVRLPELNIQKQEKMLKQKGRNLDILVARFKKMFQGKYPNQKIQL